MMTDKWFLGHTTLTIIQRAFSRHCKPLLQFWSSPTVWKCTRCLICFFLTLCYSTAGLLRSASVGTKRGKNREQKPRVHLPAPTHGRLASTMLILYFKFTLRHKWVYKLTNGKTYDHSLIEVFLFTISNHACSVF